MTLEVYLDNNLQATETVDPATLTGRNGYRRWTYTFGGVVLSYSRLAPSTSGDPDSYQVTWIVRNWGAYNTDATRGRYPCKYSSHAFDFKAERYYGSGSPTIVDNENREESWSSSGMYVRMITAQISVYFVTAPKTHLIFRDPSNGSRLVNAGDRGLVRDD